MSDVGEYPSALFVLFIGLWCGSIVGAMAQLVPYQVLVFVSIGLSFIAWQLKSSSLFEVFLLFGLLTGTGFGALGSIIPYGFFVFVLIIFGIRMWRYQGSQSPSSSINQMIAIPLLIMIAVGLLINFTYTDFCGVAVPGAVGDVCSNPSNWVNGFPTIYAGCITDCVINPFNIFVSSIFSNFVLAASNGDYFGMIASFFTAAFQSTSGLFTVLTVAIAGLLILLGSGFGFTGQVLASGFGITINEAGTRMYQSMGISLLIFGITFAALGGWIVGSSNFGGGFFTGTFGIAMAISLFVLMLTMYFYGAYIQGKDIAA